jgi:hypothetical protein
MASTRALRQVYADLEERYGRQVADAFMRAVENLRTRARAQEAVASIESQDIEAALQALDIDPAAFDEMLDRIREAHTEGGRFQAAAFPRRGADGTALTVRYDGRALRAEAWVREHSSGLITRITDETRAIIRTSLAESLSRGQNPRSALLDIIGRVNRATGRREGGILGLSAPQADYVATARNELASSDPEGLRNYLTRKARDKRFDRTIQKAIREGVAPPADKAANAITAYERRLLAQRAEIIGRVETMTALQKGKAEAIQQAIDSGKISADDVTKAWRSTGDFRVRHTHARLNGTRVRFGEAFVSPSGARLQHPMDQSMGAGIDEIAGCRCDCEYRVSFLKGLR